MFALPPVDEIAERYLDLIDDLNDEIDELEDHVEDWRRRADPRPHLGAPPRPARASAARSPRRATPSTRSSTTASSSTDVELFPRDVELHFADAYDKLLRATEGLETSRDLSRGVRDYFQAKIANDQNEVMKRLTVDRLLPARPHLHRRPLRPELPPTSPSSTGASATRGRGALIIVTTDLQLVFFRRKKWI